MVRGNKVKQMERWERTTVISKLLQGSSQPELDLNSCHHIGEKITASWAALRYMYVCM